MVDDVSQADNSPLTTVRVFVQGSMQAFRSFIRVGVRSHDTSGQVRFMVLEEATTTVALFADGLLHSLLVAAVRSIGIAVLGKPVARSSIS